MGGKLNEKQDEEPEEDVVSPPAARIASKPLDTDSTSVFTLILIYSEMNSIFQKMFPHSVFILGQCLPCQSKEILR